MFRNAEYRVALRNSLSAASNDDEGRVPVVASPKVRIQSTSKLVNRFLVLMK